MSAYEEHLKQIAMLLHDFMLCNRWTFRAFKHTHIGWARWEQCVKEGKGTLPEYLAILFAIRLEDRQQSQSFSEETEQLTVGQILAEMGFYGVGVLWTMMERVVWNDGRMTVRELEREFCARHFSKRLVRKIIMDYGLFAVDSNERVSIAKKQSAKTPDDIPDVIPDDTPDDKAKTLDDIPDDTPSNAPAYIDKEIDIEEEVEVEEKETTTPTTNSSIDDDGVLAKYRDQPWKCCNILTAMNNNLARIN